MSRLSRLREAVDRGLGEPIAVTPQILGDEYSSPDPARPPFNAVVVIRAESGRDTKMFPGGNARIAMQGVAIHVDPEAYPAALSVKAGDRIAAPDRSASFEVSRVDSLGRSRLVWEVIRI